MLNKYPLANCDYVGKIEQMLHYEDLINARYESFYKTAALCCGSIIKKLQKGKLW